MRLAHALRGVGSRVASPWLQLKMGSIKRIKARNTQFSTHILDASIEAAPKSRFVVPVGAQQAFLCAELERY